MIKIILQGEPQSSNNIYKTVCRGNFPTRYLSSKGAMMKESYQWQIKKQYKGRLLTKGISINVKLILGTRRKCDWDNFHKLSMDACTGLIWVDDSQIEEAYVRKLYDKANPRIELEIVEIDN